MARTETCLRWCGACQQRPTRRLLLGSAAGTPLLGGAQDLAAADPAARAADMWLARHAENERLSKRRQQIENRLFKEHDWPRLTRAQRKCFPEKHEMDDLYDRMDGLHDENEPLLASMPSLIATSRAEICSKFSMAALAVCPEDHSEARELVASVLRDYRALQGE